MRGDILIADKREIGGVAEIKGSTAYPNINGKVIFCQLPNGVMVRAEVFGLPYEHGGNCIYGFHIHSGSECTGNADDPFANSGSHYNPQNSEHPYHSGDLPSLFGNNGYAYMSFFTNRFSVSEIIGRTVIIHASPDDYRTQPAGNAGAKIACGKIRRIHV